MLGTYTQTVFEALAVETGMVDVMMHRMAALFVFEEECKSQGLTGEHKREHRLAHNKPVVDDIIERTAEFHIAEEGAFR